MQLGEIYVTIRDEVGTLQLDFAVALPKDFGKVALSEVLFLFCRDSHIHYTNSHTESQLLMFRFAHPVVRFHSLLLLLQVRITHCLSYRILRHTFLLDKTPFL